MTKIYPFKFLDSYNEKDTDIFFGRDEEIEVLYKMTFQSDILLVYGASGTGKTSLVSCGLAGRFKPHDWLSLTIRRGKNLNVALQQKLEEVTTREQVAVSDLDLSWLDEEEEEAEEQLTPLTKQIKEIYLQYFRPIYLIFDQFEELFVLGTKAEQTQFIQNVQEIERMEQPVKMIFVIREEYLGNLFEFERAVPQLLRKKLRVEPMNLDKVGQVIRGAASLDRSNIRLAKGEETAIIEGIFTKIKGEERTLAIQLPYLQVFLDKLYLHITSDEHRQADAVFSTQALAEIGDIGDVLRDFLEEQAVRIQKSLDKQYSDLPEDTIWQILSPLATLEGTKEPMLESDLLQRLAHLPSDVVHDGLTELDQSRILRYDENEDRYEVAHDSLAAQIAERRSDDEIALLEIRRLITSQMALKEEARELFSAKQLNFIAPYMDKLALTTEEQILIQKSKEAVAREEEAERLRAEAEKEQLLERQRLLERIQKNQRRFIGIMGIALVGMIILAIWAFNQRTKALANEKEANDALIAVKKEQAFARATEFEAYGDSYKDLGKMDYACSSYEKALSILEEYDHEELFDNILKKREETCQ